MPEEDEDAITKEQEPPILGYEHVSIAPSSSARLRGSEPWPGYDAMIPDQINAGLQTATPAEARQVLDYERRHRQRGTLIAIAKARGIA